MILGVGQGPSLASELLPPEDHLARVAANPTNAESCQWIWSRIGLPAFKGDDPPMTMEDDGKLCALPGQEVETREDAVGPSHVDICHFTYIAHHNNRMRTPDWVIERITRETVAGDNARPDQSFRPEKKVEMECRGVNADYTRSGFTRGHQAPSDDPEREVEWMKDTFFYSNAVPQFQNGFNSGVWSSLERHVKELVEGPNGQPEIYVITGPIYQDPLGRKLELAADANPCGNAIELTVQEELKDKKRVCKASNLKDESKRTACGPLEGVAVPAALYKIVYFPTNNRYNAFIIPNRDHRPEKDAGLFEGEFIDRWQVSIENVEDFTGYDFFPDLSRHERRNFEEECASFIRH